MKIIVFISTLLICTTLYASNNEWEGLILKKILHSISKHQEIAVYSKNKVLVDELKDSRFIHIVEDCTKCDFVLAKDEVNNSCQKPTIVFSYYDYLHTPTAVGVFFWQKGRPTIRFSEKRLRSFHLHVTGELSKFVSTND